MVFLHNKGEFMYNKAIEILNILEDNNYKAYIIGGYVRDKLLNIESFDIDIVTSATPKEILKYLKRILLLIMEVLNLNMMDIHLI